MTRFMFVTACIAILVIFAVVFKVDYTTSFAISAFILAVDSRIEVAVHKGILVAVVNHLKLGEEDAN